MTFKVVSTFSGCGGSSLGYKLAGGKVLLAVEWDDNAAQTYKKNFPQTSLWHGDISKLSVEKILSLTGLEPGELDIFDGSPPCQGFSTTGKRNLTDNRNQLFKQYCRLLKGLQPKCFIMENVSGMVKGNMKFIFVEILKELKACGYQVKAKLLNAKNYGVPQSRQRMIFIGVRKDLGIEPSHPIGSTKIITVRQALKDCPEGERISPTSSFFKKTLPRLKEGEKMADYHPKKSYFSSFRIKWNVPCPTICKTFVKNRTMLFHPSINASLSIEEVKRLSSFPDDFQFIGKFEEQWARMGNCVPPLFMKAIATHIHENILQKL
jgi:DNA (cytosine-5)-methyltransferase 1